MEQLTTTEGEAVLIAELTDGTSVEYLAGAGSPTDGTNSSYFAPDKSYLVQFCPAAGPWKPRLEVLVARLNPTLYPQYGLYWRELFCWPLGVIVKPRPGIVYPAFGSDFVFSDGPFKNQLKRSSWFISNRLLSKLPENDRGTWIDYLQICVLLARAVRRIHQAGLAHSDLSPHNILIDPATRRCKVIGIQDLVVPGFLPPEVVGTPGYLAPELLVSYSLPFSDPQRIVANPRTDEHALAVLIYEFLLKRSPLRGPKVHSATDPCEDERIGMGNKALFIENPSDLSNRPSDLAMPYHVLGPFLGELVQRAFVDGLHAPSKRPLAREWERALIKTWARKIPCPNSDCPNKWYIFNASDSRCPFCHAVRTGSVPVLKLYRQVRVGHWIPDGELVLYHNQHLFSSHIYDYSFPAEGAPHTELAFCIFHEGRWLLVNQGLRALTSPNGLSVAIGRAIELKDGGRIMLSTERHGRLAEVSIVPA